MKESIAKLVQVGLTDSEARVYFNLLKKEQFTATEIAKVSNIGRTQVYEILTSLVEKHMVTETLGAIKKYSAVNPETAFKVLNREYEEKQLILGELGNSLSEFYAKMGHNNDPMDFVQVYKSDKIILEKMNEFSMQAAKSVLTFGKPPYVGNSDELEDVDHEEIQIQKNGAIYRSIMEVEHSNISDFILRAKYYNDLWGEVRVMDRVHLKGIVFDTQKVLLSLRNYVNHQMEFTALIITHPDFAAMVEAMFETNWINAVPLNDFIENYKRSI
jgi:HTH-type transcriptional regulator, sugar sensing transcriptional regulator